jgi:hypothetical protein
MFLALVLPREIAAMVQVEEEAATSSLASKRTLLALLRAERHRR